jgi:2-dehydro-3-deoxygluconokinase
MRALLGAPRTFLLSFDVNLRPALDQDPAVLRELAALADIVLVGADEAETLWGAGDPAAIRDVLPEPPAIVVKQAEWGATLLEHGRPAVFCPALRVDVVEPVGAGDAFAAGYLAALLAGEPPVRRLRAGHLRAAAALRTRDDVGPPLPAARVAALLDAGDEEWKAACVP